ncbi:HAD-IA family hydrolase [Methylocaldum sp.]|uniref:HAD family hydrolase n=1 Tax=Methylocaldum sp. TaxID=1969727 RepID=UPI002D39498C|nr:HAD-IA family hydrolase [Methylocaldum sp.]HYE38091.1 HAD-IA family hydrolase [Methylocaldum sp.]
MAVNPTVSAVLFDLDGTLLDTAPDLVFAANAALAEADIPPRSMAELKPCISGGAAVMLRCALNGDYEQVLFDRVLQRMLELYQSHVADRTQFFDGIESVLDALEQRDVPWGIVTNKMSRFTDPLLEKLNLAGRAGCVISGDTTAEKKPHPLPLLEASRRLDLTPEGCVYIGDAPGDVEAGRRAGMTTLTALYGYIAAGDAPHDWGADGLLASPRDFLPWLDGALS